MRIERYRPELAEEVAALVHRAFAEHRNRVPLNLLDPPVPWATTDELADTLTGETVLRDASFVAIADGRPISAAIAVNAREGIGWWRIATDPEHRREGLARRCVRAGEQQLARICEQPIYTLTTVDGRWEVAERFLAALGYELEDPERRNITMMCTDWRSRELTPPEGYRLTTLGGDDIEQWIRCRNIVFDAQVEPDWFRERFESRPDFDPSGWYVVWRDGRIVAISGALAVEDERDPKWLRGGMIEYVGVVPEERGKKLGELVVSACLNWLAEREANPVLLITQPFRVAAIRLYEKLGFQIIGAWHRWTKRLQ